MANIQQLLNDEIRRLARKEIRLAEKINLDNSLEIHLPYF